MTTATFEKALKQGRGSAIITLRTAPDREIYRPAVLKTCLRDTRIECQVEEERSGYLYSAIGVFAYPDDFLAEIQKEFLCPDISWGLFEQLTGLLCYFADDENQKQELRQKATGVLWDGYDRLLAALNRPKKTLNFYRRWDQLECLCVWLLRLGGKKEFQQMAADIGGLMRRYNPEPLCFNWFMTQAVSQFGRRWLDNFFLRHQDRPEIAIFGQLLTTLTAEPVQLMPPPSVEETVIASRQPGFDSRALAIRLARNGTAEELGRLALEALAEPDADVKAKLLWAFRITPFPLDIAPLLEYLETGHPALREVTLETLALLRDDRVRVLAKELLASPEKEAEHPVAAEMLCVNFNRTDAAVLEKAVRALRQNRAFWAYKRVVRLIAANTYAPVKLLPYIWKKTACSHCRYDIAAAMGKRGALTPEIIEECRYEAHEGTKKWAEKR
ncbi:MAG: hypothetical protein FWE80_02020 [Oscillospiraceae bacterium]|nr:hypothetical protein [Oscillospiraceae bacterium]